MCGVSLSLFILIVGSVKAQEDYRSSILRMDDANKSTSIPNDWNVEDPSFVSLISVRNVNVDKINTGAFKNFTKVEELVLTGRIPVIEDDAFTGMNKLYYIKLNGVGIQRVGPKVFHNLNRLQWLDLARNELKEIHLTNLPLLTELYLSQNDITEFSRNTFVNLENLESIDLSENKIRALKNWAFYCCPNLTTLNLNKNQITDIDSMAFIDVSKLEKLSLRHNNLTRLTKDPFNWLRNLKRLDLSNNLINEIGFISYFHFMPLTYYDLSHNNITTPPWDFLLSLSELTDLRLDHNSITSLPQSFFVHTPKLENLDLGFNLIKELYLSDELEKLRRVSLHHNKLQSIELPTATQMNIEVLELGDNNLTHLNESFQHLINLRELSLNKNKIKSFPLCIRGSITNLELSDNELHGIALDKFCGSATQGKLLRVDLSSNQFTSYNLTYTNKSLQETQPDLYEIDLSVNFLNADSVKQIQTSDLRHIEVLKIEPQLKVDININLNESLNTERNPNGNETTIQNATVLAPVDRSDDNENQYITWIVVTSAALAAVAVFAVIAAILFVWKQRRRTNLNPNVNDAVMLDELYDDVRGAPFYDYPRFPIYDYVRRPHIYHYPTFRPWYDEVRPQPVYLSVLPDIPGPQQLEEENHEPEPEENIYEEID